MSDGLESFKQTRTKMKDFCLKQADKYKEFPNLVDLHTQKANRLAKEVSIAREPIDSDISERDRIRSTYPDTIKNTINDDQPLWFHGVRDFLSIDNILSSGHLGYLEEEETKSFTSPGSLDVTTKNSIATTMDFAGLSTSLNKYLPAGCVFAISPKDEQESKLAKESTGSEASIDTVHFRENPDRLFAIISTRENLDPIRSCAVRNGIDPSKVFSFDGFAKHMEQQKHKQAAPSEIFKINSGKSGDR